ncbi:N-acetylmuramoyl-L-alanine amidase [Streptomyces smyrnaeus]|nr:N-acetylmuramoyl-L-alanine amidase [Streptomyces smyrnaeus]
MRANLAQSIGVASAAALLLPLAPLATAAALSPSAPTSPSSPSSRSAASSPDEIPGHTQSLSFGDAAAEPPGTRAPGEARTSVRLAARTVRPYSLLGVVWDSADQPLPGRVEVRTRDADTGRWSAWRQLDVHPSGAGRTGEGAGARGATAPLWVGASDGVEARVLLERTDADPALPEGLRLELVDPGPGGTASGETADPSQAPDAAEPAKPAEPTRRPGADKAPDPGQVPDPDKAPGTGSEPGTGAGPDTGTETGPGTDTGAGTDTRPGADTGPGTDTRPGTDPGVGTDTGAGTDPGTGGGTDAGAEAGGAGGQAEAGAAVLPALSKEATRKQYPTAESFVGPRPRIVTRKGWGADEKLRESGHAYTKTVKAAFVHHTAMTNHYKCGQAPSIIRAMYRYHVKSSKWRDIGYNFLVDKCGTIYEGRAGGVAKPVMGAHTYGFNTNTTGIAVLGSYDKTEPSKRAVDAIARLTGWKLGLFGVDPAGKTWLKSGGGKFKKGRKIRFHTVSGHKDGYVTECPGARLYGKLGEIRTAAARLQGR